MMPLVSVIMPLFNAADTLFLALASLQAQTCENWECIIVDDGSTDNPEQIINAVGDSRIQYHHLDRNRGRGYARQCALEMANGDTSHFLTPMTGFIPRSFESSVACSRLSPTLRW